MPHEPLGRYQKALSGVRCLPVYENIIELALEHSFSPLRKAHELCQILEELAICSFLMGLKRYELQLFDGYDTV